MLSMEVSVSGCSSPRTRRRVCEGALLERDGRVEEPELAVAVRQRLAQLRIDRRLVLELLLDRLAPRAGGS